MKKKLVTRILHIKKPEVDQYELMKKAATDALEDQLNCKLIAYAICILVLIPIVVLCEKFL